LLRLFKLYNRLSCLLPKFAQVTHSFHTELKKRISNYFEEVGKSTTGNYNLFLKAVILMVGFAFIYIHLVFFTPAFWAILESVLLGGMTAAIGFNVMHDGAHGSFSKYKWVNGFAAFR
jgi:linoleoyl-CoA desaturase